MKRIVLVPALLLLLSLRAPADTVDLGAHGTLAIDVPKGWKLTSAPWEQPGVAITITPPEGVNAQFLLNILFVQKGMSNLKADVDTKVLNEAGMFVDMSVEKKKVLRKFAMAGDAYGSYCVFTDAALVGKPPQKDNFKVLSAGIIWFSDDISGATSILGDDEKGPEFAAMIAMASSATLKPR
jgi:hypothetical protein